MHTATRPFAAAGISLIGATAIALTPVTAPTVGSQIQRMEAQVEQVAVQLTAAANPFAEFGKLYQATLDNLQNMVAIQAANPTPIFTQFLKNQLTALQDILKLAANPGSLILDHAGTPGVPFTPSPSLINALGGALHGVFTNVTTAVPPLLKSALADLLHGHIEEANNQVLLAVMNTIIPLTELGTPLLNTIAYPLQGLVSIIDKLGPIGAEMKKLMQDPGHVDAVLVKGAERARAIAFETMKAVKDIVGFVQPK